MPLEQTIKGFENVDGIKMEDYRINTVEVLFTKKQGKIIIKNK